MFGNPLEKTNKHLALYGMQNNLGKWHQVCCIFLSLLHVLRFCLYLPQETQIIELSIWLLFW